jgi:SAM-dependent methyltransferase
MMRQEKPMKDEKLRESVRERYARAALAAKNGTRSACCETGCCATSEKPDPITSDLYGDRQRAEVPVTALSASLGCGNPTAVAKLKEGEVVLDLGSGGGIDVLLSAKRVGPTGKAYGLDMTDEMLVLARENQRKSGLRNVEFLKGILERIPLPENTVDVILSNCVINLVADKDAALREAFRVLKPGGRLAVADVVIRGRAPAGLRRNLALWAGCLGGALAESEYRSKLRKAGFEEVAIERTRVYDVSDLREMAAAEGIDGRAIGPRLKGRIAGAFVRAKKPR